MVVALKQTELHDLLRAVVATISDTVGSLVGTEIEVKNKDIVVREPDELLASLQQPCAIARGAMDKDYAGSHLLTAFEVPDAVAMAGLLMMAPPDMIAKRRSAPNLVGEDVEAFGELGNVLYSGFSNVLRDRITNFDLRMQDLGTIAPGDDEGGVLGDGPLVVFTFSFRIGDYPESTAFLALDVDTAQKWNGSPLGLGTEPVGEAVIEGGGTQRPDDELESIPQAPIRGELAAFLLRSEVMRTLRLSCRRVGLELHRHGRGEIPNPAAHKNQIVVLDVPTGEDRRFDWCRRIKELSQTTKVVLLIHHPSRARVTQAFLSKADAILGYPCEEQHLSQKLDEIAPSQGSPEPDEPEPSPEGEPETS